MSKNEILVCENSIDTNNIQSKEFKKELENLINRFSIDNETSTPDFILAELISSILSSYKETMNKNINWHSGWEK